MRLLDLFEHQNKKKIFFFPSLPSMFSVVYVTENVGFIFIVFVVVVVDVVAAFFLFLSNSFLFIIFGMSVEFIF